MNPKDFDESKKVARQGGNVAKVAKKELEAKTGKKVVSAINAKSVFRTETKRRTGILEYKNPDNKCSGSSDSGQ